MEGPELQPACLDGGVARIRLVLRLTRWGQHIITEALDSGSEPYLFFLIQIFFSCQLKKKTNYIGKSCFWVFLENQFWCYLRRGYTSGDNHSSHRQLRLSAILQPLGSYVYACLDWKATYPKHLSIFAYPHQGAKRGQ